MARFNTYRAQVDLFNSRLTGEARRQELIRVAKQAGAEAADINRRALGRDIDSVIIVDGRRGAGLETVKTGGIIAYEFAVQVAAIDYAYEQLLRISPVDTSPKADDIVYRDEHVLLVNGQQAGPPPVRVPVDAVVTLVNFLPYARRLERGWSEQAPRPPGIYEAVAAMVKAKFGNIVDVTFNYISLVGATPPGKVSGSTDIRFPSITISPKGASLPTSYRLAA